MVGVLPYLALQLKAIVLGFVLLIGANPTEDDLRTHDTALLVSLVLALISVLSGTRNLAVTEHHQCMMPAIAFESVVKLLAFLAVGVFVIFGLFDGVTDLFEKALAAPQLEEFWQRELNWPAMLMQTYLAMVAVVCLPRQFHVTVVENNASQ